MRKQLAACFVIAMSCIALGCTTDGRPTWGSGASSARQRQRAQHFDPYADPTAGPVLPEVRPHDYASPPPEPTRARWSDYGAQRYGSEN